MIDVHSHILPMVDDGASSIEMALDLLYDAYNDGTDAIILTPHNATSYDFINPYKKIQSLYDEFSMIVKDSGIPIKIYLGSEYLYTNKEAFIKDIDNLTTLNGTRYLLIEFYFDVEKETILEAIDTLKAYGYIPVIAHPERFSCVRSSKEFMHTLVKRGAVLQVNKGSILGRYGIHVKEAAHYLLQQHFITFVGSDAHHPQHRSSLMYEAYSLVRYLYGEEYAEDIFYHNPSKLLKIK